ncbi:MAG: FecR domain-containing protein [Verrucomicrobiota bacterium]
MRRALLFVLAAIFSQGSISLPAATSGDTPKAVVVEVIGAATYVDASAQSGPIKRGQTLASGTTITTGPGSTVRLDLGLNGQQLTVKPDSVLSLDKLNIQRTGADVVIETKLEVRKGSILGNVKKLSAASSYEVKTANGVAGIRGTAFHIFAIGIFRCLNGQIIVTISSPGAPARAFTVTTGNQLGGGGPGGGQLTLTPIPPQELRQLLSEARPIIQRIIVAQRNDSPRPTDHPNPPPDVQAIRRQIFQEARSRGLSEEQAQLVVNAFFATAASQGIIINGDLFQHYIEAVLSPIHPGGND